jgi:flavin-dependent dehydrogenase
MSLFVCLYLCFLGHTAALYRASASPTKPARVAIIGSGIGGASAAYFIRNATDVAITILESESAAGGRLLDTTIEGRVYELGGSEGIPEANSYFITFTDLLGLKRIRKSLDTIGIWNGERFVVRSDVAAWKALKRYAFPHWLCDILDDDDAHNRHGMSVVRFLICPALRL